MIIAISGKAGSGKDTLGQELVRQYPGLQLKKFASALHQVCSAITGLPVQEFTHNKTRVIKPYGITIRDMLQQVGTDLMRNQFHEDVWVNALLATYEPTQHWVITDLRFVNEYNALYNGSMDAYLVRLDGVRDIPEMSHSSETALDHITNWDYRIYNGKDKSADLEKVASEIIHWSGLTEYR